MTPLHAIGDSIRHILLLIPIGIVRGVFVLLLLGLLIWVLRLPKHVTRRATAVHEPPALSEDLKLWAGLTLGIQIVIYLWT